MNRPKHKKKDVVAAIRKAKGGIYIAAAKLGISQQTMRNYLRRWPDLMAVVRMYRLRMLDLAENKLLAAIRKGDRWAVQFALRTIGRKRGYKTVKEVDLNVAEVDRAIERELADVAREGKTAVPPAAAQPGGRPHGGNDAGDSGGGTG